MLLNLNYIQATYGPAITAAWCVPALNLILLSQDSEQEQDLPVPHSCNSNVLTTTNPCHNAV